MLRNKPQPTSLVNDKKHLFSSQPIGFGLFGLGSLVNLRSAKGQLSGSVILAGLTRIFLVGWMLSDLR